MSTEGILPIHHPGEVVPESGTYDRIDAYGDDILDNEGLETLQIVVSKGERFPPSKHPGEGYRLAARPHHELAEG